MNNVESSAFLFQYTSSCNKVGSKTNSTSVSVNSEINFCALCSLTDILSGLFNNSLYTFDSRLVRLFFPILAAYIIFLQLVLPKFKKKEGIL